MSTIRTASLVLGLLALVPVSGLLADGKDDVERTKPRGKFTVSKETTFATGPLDKDGYFDFVAALNKAMRQGATPENNASVLLWKVFGPHPEGGKLSPEFFKELGIEAPPERGDYFIDLPQYVKAEHKIGPGKELEEVLEQMDRATLRPWTAKDYPKMAAWLKANEKPLALVAEASKRTHYFSPLVPSKMTKKGGPSGLISALLPGVQQCRRLATALTARAMLRLGEGASDDAWQDLLSCHRLGRLVGRGGTLIEGLVGVAIDSVAGRADLAFLDRAKLNAKQLESCMRDLQKLPPLPDMAEKINLTERFTFLESVLLVDRYGFGYVEGLAGGDGKGGTVVFDRFLDETDWDSGLRNGNKWYDRLVAVSRKDRAARAREWSQIDTELKALKVRLVNGLQSGELAKSLAGKDKAEARGKAFSDILVTLLLPAVNKAQDSADRARQNQDNLFLAFALARYHQDQGSYPKTLAALSPKYLAKVPADLFSGKALVYKPTEKGYLLYSVGINGKDDGGRGYNDDPPGDDLGVRMPLPELRRK